jgi:hypothetical protein
MLETYRDILRGNRIEWVGDAPKLLHRGQGVRVYVTFLDPVETETAGGQGKRMAAALEELAATRPGGGTKDPAACEPEVRQERPLPAVDD